MQKTSISTPSKNNSFNYFVYEMKDTNQLLKDLISCNMSDTMSRSGENKEQILHHQILKDSTSHPKTESANVIDKKNTTSHIKLTDSSIFPQFLQKDFVKYQDSYQNEQNEFFSELKNDHNSNIKYKKNDNPLEDLILQRFYNDFSDNEELDDTHKHSLQKYKTKDNDFRQSEQYQSSKQTKKQKKGLANISLRVKNIVSEHKKLSYKQVSDLVLQYSKDEIEQLEQTQKIKQVKNIKRRVYDALNVLVAMGILGKQQRCVCNTQWTNVPGKKHSIQWQNVNNKIDHIARLKKNCADKSQALKLLIDKYNAIAALRNKHNIEQQQQKQKQNSKLEEFSLFSNFQKDRSHQKDQKLMFPVITFCPSLEEESNQKLTVQLQKNQENQERMKISGKNIMILGDFDCVLELDLQKYRDLIQQKKVQEEINQYAAECVRKKYANYKLDYSPPIQQHDIEDYFNDHVFDTK